MFTWNDQLYHEHNGALVFNCKSWKKDESLIHARQHGMAVLSQVVVGSDVFFRSQ